MLTWWLDSRQVGVIKRVINIGLHRGKHEHGTVFFFFHLFMVHFEARLTMNIDIPLKHSICSVLFIIFHIPRALL